MCVVGRPVLCMTSFLLPSPLANQIVLSCSLGEALLCVRGQPSGVRGTQVVRPVSKAVFPAGPSFWSCPIFTGTRSVGISMFALHPCVESSTATSFLIREQESRPISRENLSVFQCRNVLANVFD